MTNADPLPATVLNRKAVVYVRQSTQTQVQVNRESQRRQYDLVEDARRRGFRDVEVIDDDLGRSASGTVARPGFERLVASLCAGEVGRDGPHKHSDSDRPQLPRRDIRPRPARQTHQCPFGRHTRGHDRRFAGGGGDRPSLGPGARADHQARDQAGRPVDEQRRPRRRCRVPLRIGTAPDILVAMDWTDFDHDSQLTLMPSLATGHPRRQPRLAEIRTRRASGRPNDAGRPAVPRPPSNAGQAIRRPRRRSPGLGSHTGRRCLSPTGGHR